jgi:hypothetical protein
VSHADSVSRYGRRCEHDAYAQNLSRVYNHTRDVTTAQNMTPSRVPARADADTAALANVVNETSTLKDGGATQRPQTSNATGQVRMVEREGHLGGEVYGVEADGATEGNVTVDATERNVTLDETEGHVTVDATEGNVTVDAMEGNVTVDATEGNVTVDTTEGNVTVDAMEGNVTVDATEGNVTVDATEGNVTVDAADVFGLGTIGFNTEGMHVMQSHAHRDEYNSLRDIPEPHDDHHDETSVRESMYAHIMGDNETLLHEDGQTVVHDGDVWDTTGNEMRQTQQDGQTQSRLGKQAQELIQAPTTERPEETEEAALESFNTHCNDCINAMLCLKGLTFASLHQMCVQRTPQDPSHALQSEDTHPREQTQNVLHAEHMPHQVETLQGDANTRHLKQQEQLAQTLQNEVQHQHEQLREHQEKVQGEVTQRTEQPQQEHALHGEHIQQGGTLQGKLTQIKEQTQGHEEALQGMQTQPGTREESNTTLSSCLRGVSWPWPWFRALTFASLHQTRVQRTPQTLPRLVSKGRVSTEPRPPPPPPPPHHLPTTHAPQASSHFVPNLPKSQHESAPGHDKQHESSKTAPNIPTFPPGFAGRSAAFHGDESSRQEEVSVRMHPYGKTTFVNDCIIHLCVRMYACACACVCTRVFVFDNT